jgi:hypothetical protein
MSELNPQPLPPRAVRVAVPGEIFNDLERFQKVQASILGRAGCPGCTSGLQIIWQNYENWVVDLEGAVHPAIPGALVGGLRAE